MRLLLALIFWAISVVAVQADIDRLMSALRFAPVIEVLVSEERANGRALADGFFPDRPQDGWDDQVTAIHTVDRTTSILSQGMASEFRDHDLNPMIGYFEQPEVQVILGLETSARAVFSDWDLTEAIIADLPALQSARPALWDQVERYITYNRLITSNVESAYLSNLAFAAGLIDGGQYNGMTPERLAAEIWPGEEETAKNTRDWLMAFFMTAYGPADPKDLERYINYSLTPDGSLLNTAVDAAFRRLYAETSFDMGRAVADYMGGDAI